MRHDVWEAFVLYEPQSGTRIGVYASEEEAEADCENWRDEGYKLAPCEIKLVKKHRYT